MIIVDFEKKPFEFGTPNYSNKTIQTKNPHEIFSKQQKSKGTTILDMKCCCSDPNCKKIIGFYYTGLNRYGSSKNLGSDTEVNISPSHKEKEGEANNVMWNPTEENVSNFIAFSETVKEAITFKQELLNGLFAELQVKIKGHNEIQIIVRKEKTEMHFILFEIPNTFPKVPLLYESKGYRECLGVIASLPASTDTSNIKNDYADMKNYFFEPIIAWVKSLGEENQLNLEINNIWVMPE